MGLDIAVGLRALMEQEGADPDELAMGEDRFRELNDVLADARLPPHREPARVATAFEAQMWGYSGLHTVRRLAAWVELEGRLPPEPDKTGNAAADPLISRLFERQSAYVDSARREPTAKGFLGRLLSRRPSPTPKPRFQHLLWHSDAEGYYIPRDFADVVIDEASPPRPSVAGMVGSSVQLLAECRELADWIELPPETDPESEDIWLAADTPVEDGPLWKRYAVETFCLSRLIRASEVSIEAGAAIVFC